MEQQSRLAGWLIGAALLLAVTVWGIVYASQQPKPRLTSDNIGSTLGGRHFVISGDGFMVYGKTRVLVDGNEAADVAVLSGHSITAKAPKGSDGLKGITVINPNGKRGELAKAYLYSKYKPDIATVSPKVLPPAGGTLVTVTGTGFTQSPIFLRFQASLIPFTIVDDTTLTFTAPPAPHPVPTNANLEVETKDGRWVSDEYGLVYR